MIFDKCYKICRKRINCRFVSFCGFNKGNAAYTEYALNLWTLPPIKQTKLFAFNSLKYARDFLSVGPLQEYGIFEAECLNPIELKFRLPSTELDVPKVNMLLIKGFWCGVKADKYSDDMLFTPSGTIGADAIKLIREIT